MDDNRDILRFSASNPNDKPGRRNAFYAFAAPDYEVMSGDVLEYDIRIKGTSPDLVGTVDMDFSDGTTLRDSGVFDQNGLSAHPGVPLGERVKDKWLHRVLPLEPCVGRTIRSCDVALATDCAKPGLYTVYLASVRVTRAGETAAWLYQSGEIEAARLTNASRLTEVTLVRVQLGDMDAPLPPPPVPSIMPLYHAQLTELEDGLPEAPRLATGLDGGAWIVWLNRAADGRDVVCLRTRAASAELDKWTPVQELSDGGSDMPAIAAQPETERSMVAWVRNRGDDWLLESRLLDGNSAGPLTTVTDSAEGRVAHPTLIPDHSGGFWAAWENYHNGNFTLRVSQWKAGKWGDPLTLDTGAGNAYHPSLALDSHDRLWVGFCRAEEGRRDLLLTALASDGEVHLRPTPICIAEERTYQCGRSSLACDAEDRIWIAWEHISDRKRRDCYFGMCECHVACYADGKLARVSPQGTRHLGRVPLRAANHQQPELRFDRQGRLWLFSRASREVRRTWTVAACCLDGAQGWTHPTDVLPGQPLGRRGPTAVDIDPQGRLHVAWQSDNLLSGIPVGDTRGSLQTLCASLPDAKALGPVALVPLDLETGKPKPHYRAHTPRRTVEVGGERFTLLFGNLHEHSIISRCWSDCSDGDLHDNYRYGMDVEGYDFVGMTDHGFDLYEVAWRRTRQAARFYTQGDAFIGLPAYEWTRSGPDKPEGSGHRNVILASDEDAAKILLDSGNVPHKDSPESNRPEKLWDLLRKRGVPAVTIPHHTADKQHPMDWDSHDPEYQCVVEIFQCRESCEHRGCPRETRNTTAHEGTYVQDALARGYRFGFVASGDHNSMGDGVAAVLVRDVSTAGIFEALQHRRCYATTGDHIFLDFRVDGCLMGGETARKGSPVLELTVAGTEPLQDIVIFRNNEIVLHRTAEDLAKHGADIRLRHVDETFDGPCNYYARVIQENDEIAWASPVWVTV